jgi:uncharacterized membrane protein
MQRMFDIFAVTITMCLAVGASAGLLKASGKDIPLATVVSFAVGIALVICGNYLGKVPRNFLVGIFFTPWCLTSDEVWSRAHRLAGRVLVVGGLGLLLYACYPKPWLGIALVASTIAALMSVLLYSYRLYLHIDAAGKHSDRPDSPGAEETL